MEKTNIAMQGIFNSCYTVVQQQLLPYIQITELAKNTILIKEGDVCNGIYVVIDGCMKLYIKDKKRNKVFLFKTKDEIIGLQLAMCSLAFNYYASAIENSVVAYIPVEYVKKMMKKNPKSFFSLMKKLHQKALFIEERSSLLMMESSEKLVIHSIADLQRRFGVDRNGYLRMHLPVKDLASYLCMSKTNLYKTIQSLKEKTLLSHHLGKYRIEGASYY
jgi:CRP/FNR family transcriptional regulator